MAILKLVLIKGRKLKYNEVWVKNKQLSFSHLPPSILEAIRGLARRNIIFDLFSIIATSFAFTYLIICSNLFYTSYGLIAVYMLLQGFVIHCVIQIYLHDYGIHLHIRQKNILKKLLIASITAVSPTHYFKDHILHHLSFPNHYPDPDVATNQPRNFFERILSFTALGFFVISPIRNKAYGNPKKCLNYSKGELLLIKLETTCFFLLASIAILLYMIGIKFLFLGWLLPLMVGTPIFVGIRTCFEHGKVTSEEIAFGSGTNSKVPLMLRYTPYVSLFGEGHIIHHYFPTIPWYNYSKAISLLRPYLPCRIEKNSLQILMLWLKGNL